MLGSLRLPSDDIRGCGRVQHGRDGLISAKVTEERASRQRQMHGTALIGDVDMLALDLEIENGIHQNRASHTAHKFPRQLDEALRPSIVDGRQTTRRKRATSDNIDRVVNGIDCLRADSPKLVCSFRVTPEAAHFTPITRAPSQRVPKVPGAFRGSGDGGA